MSSPAVNHLVSFLTRPLMRSLAPTTIVSLQVYLHRVFSSSPQQPLVLSAACPPPPAIQQACIVSGVRWEEWIQRLSSGIDLKIFLTETSLAVKLGAMPRRMLWVATNNADAPAPFARTHARASSFRAPPMISFGSRLRMRATLFPARPRARRSRRRVEPHAYPNPAFLVLYRRRCHFRIRRSRFRLRFGYRV
ncbi:hypothetical protein MVEN_01829300 [Mycena venus]|uniref:Uncharacterized protein n=1 Tax=Mycena venus TaxID=2733690 RepID=A0A8H7CP55_9AGAR|nr:hypothetical protein MVEN_01829300 [Mycena venus]